MSVHFSSASAEWATPSDFFAALVERFGPFDLDPCATADNAKASSYYTIESDGLSQPWGSRRVFMNPPYGRSIGKWMRKAYESALAGATVVCLVPARTDTAWWHDYAMKGETEFVRGRLKFGDRNKDAPFPCALVVFRPLAPRQSIPTRRAETRSGLRAQARVARWRSQTPNSPMNTPTHEGDVE